MTKIQTLIFFIGTICFSLNAEVRQKESLLNNAWKIYSQSGEEGILDEILHRIDIKNGFFVEFGANDGILFSNTRFLAEKGWNGAFIECDKAYLENLRKNCKTLPNIQCIEEFVAATPSDPVGKTLEAIAAEHFPNEEIDVLSIDIDGLDYLIFENLKCKPKVICIESSGYWSPYLTTAVPKEVAKLNLGQPLPVMIDIARKNGYEPVCYLVVNLFLVRKDLYSHFSKIKNDALTLWKDSWSYMGEKMPEHQRFITENRRTSPLIKKYDPF